VAFPEDEFRADYEDALTNPRKMSKWLRYSLNVWDAADARWFVGSVDWSKCGSGPQLDTAGRQCWVGVDLASNLDMTSVCFLFREPDGSYYAEWKYFVPRETVSDRVRKDRIPYDDWIRDGWVIVTDGSRLDHEHVAREIVEFSQTHEIRCVGCDPWQAGPLETLLQREGLTVRDIPQRTSYLNAPAKLLEALIVEKRLRHGNNPVSAWNANNVAVYEDATGMIKPDKSKSSEKIDGIVALVNALALASTDDAGEMSAEDWTIRVV